MEWITIVAYLLPFVIGWLLKSPLKRWVPAPVAEVLERLDPLTIQRLAESLSTKEKRTETAIEEVQDIAAKYGVPIDRATAAQVVKYLTSAYKAGYKWVDERL